MNIILSTSMVLDAICFLEQSFLEYESMMKEPQLALIKELNAKIGDRGDKECMGMSGICLIISTYTDNEQLDTMTLDGLIDIFKNIEDVRKVVEERITNEFTASYIIPTVEILQSGLSERFIKQIELLKEIGFEEAWHKQALPHIEEEIKLRQEELEKYSIDEMLENIVVLKNSEPIKEVKIVVSMFSFPIAFGLKDNSFLNCFFGTYNHMVPMIAHELMHGFASAELTKLYGQYMQSDEYLQYTHTRLIDKHQSGDEEEFVKAAEYYLCFKAGVDSREGLMKYAKGNYSGDCPVSVILFDLLLKEETVPQDYNAWLLDIFKGDRLPTQDIKAYVNDL